LHILLQPLTSARSAALCDRWLALNAGAGWSFPAARAVSLWVVFLFVSFGWSAAQAASKEKAGFGTGFVVESAKPTYTLWESVNAAIRNYPSLRRDTASVASTRASITVEKTAYLPTFEGNIQTLRASQNVVAGTVFPQTIDVIPIQTGGVSHSSTFNSIYSDNEGINFSWELWDFGLRHANVLRARAQHSEAGARVQLTKLDIAYRAAIIYLGTVANNEVIRAQTATVKRMEAWALVVHTLVDKGLKPGVDSSRADADVANARIALLQAEEETELSRVDLAEAMGLAGAYIAIVDKGLVTRPREGFTPLKVDLALHPEAILKGTAVNTAQAQVHIFDRTYYPHLWYHSAVWGRGSGQSMDPRTIAGGFLPQSGNWAVGFEVSFPAMEYFKVRAQKRQALNFEENQRAQYDLVMQELSRKDARAKVLLDKTRRIADETLFYVKAARDNEVKALERYRVGLTDVVEVAEAERIVARAEADAAVAEVRVWQAILDTTYAQGDVGPFLKLAQAAQPGPGGN
jgi:outer membrane protein